MHKIFLAVSSIIVAGFLMKSYKKLREKPIDQEEVYRRMRAEYDRRRAEARPTIAKLDAISTPRARANMMSAIDTLQHMRDALRPSNDQCDAMAMAPVRFA